MAVNDSLSADSDRAGAKRRTKKPNACRRLPVNDLARFPEENPNPVLRARADGKLLYTNLAGEKLLENLGWGDGEKLPSALWRQVPTKDAGDRAEFDLEAGDQVYAVAASHGVAGNEISLYFRDVTSRRQAEEALKRLNAELERRVAEQTSELRQACEAAEAERQRLYDVLETLPVYVVLLSADYHVPFANRFFRERFGESAGKRCFEYLFDRIEPCENCETFKVLKTGEPHHWQWTGPDGRDYDIYDFPFTDSDGSSLIMEMGIDVTDMHKAQAALAEINRTLEQRVAERTARLAKTNKRLRGEIEQRRKAQADLVRAKEDWERTFDSVPDLIALLDKRHRIVRVNRAMARVLGVEAEQCIGLPCFKCVHGTNRPPESCPHACTLVDGREHSAEVHEDRLGGDFLVSTTPMFDTAGKLIGSVHVARNITERKQAEESLRTLNETLEQRVAERTAVAESRSRLLLRLAAELSQAEHRERKRLASILHDDLQQLLLAARLRLANVGDSDRQQPSPDVEAVDNLLGECMNASRNLTMELSPPILHRGTLADVLEWLGGWFAEKHGFSLSIEVPQELPPTREHIRVFLFQAVRELLLNTVKHSGIMEARIVVSLEGDCLRIQFKDRGSDFDADAVREKLDRAHSFGLLSIRERLEAMDGRMEFESTPTGGACFRLIVPVSAMTEPLIEHGMDKSVASYAPAEKPRSATVTVRILVVDDHKVVREGFVGLLNREPDCEVVGQAADGEEAVRQAETLRPDVIIMDVEMPKLDGVEATRRIKQRQPEVLIVGLSLHEEETVWRAMIDAGATVHLSKNGPAEDLIEAIRRACGRGWESDGAME